MGFFAVDLVMWRDVSKSAFIFGLGTFIIISLSYTKDLNIRSLSLLLLLFIYFHVLIPCFETEHKMKPFFFFNLLLQLHNRYFLSGSCLSCCNFLVQIHYLQVIPSMYFDIHELHSRRTKIYFRYSFLCTNLWNRGVPDVDYTSQEYYVLGEGEAMWLVKMVLPYLNEFLVKLRALFSGDPATTMKVNSLFFFFFSPSFPIFYLSVKITRSQQNMTMAVGSSAVCSGKVWELHHCLEDGQIGWVWLY